MPRQLKPIPNENPSKKRVNKNVRKKTASSAKSHLQRKDSIQINGENKVIKAVGYKFLEYAGNMEKMTKKAIQELIYETQKSLIYLQKHQRRIVHRQNKNNRKK
jgi:hypothetical protein